MKALFHATAVHAELTLQVLRVYPCKRATQTSVCIYINNEVV